MELDPNRSSTFYVFTGIVGAILVAFGLRTLVAVIDLWNRRAIIVRVLAQVAVTRVQVWHGVSIRAKIDSGWLWAN